MARKLTIQLLITLFSASILMAGNPNWSVSGQIRHRFEAVDKDFVDSTGFKSTQLLRSRVNFKFAPVEGVTGLVQLQDSRKYGEETSTLSDGSADNIDFHQAYIVLKPFFLDALCLKVGRFEAAYGPQRIIGTVGWHNIGRSFDGVVLKFQNNLVDLDVFNMKDGIVDVSGLYASLKLIEKQKTQLFYIRDGLRATSGLYASGSFGSIGYEAEAAYQMGEMSSSVNYAAWMAAFNASLKLGSIKLSAGVDMISGDDASTTDKYEAFNTLYATNHKYYGSMDYFLNLPVHTGGLGLVDLHAKAVLPKVAGLVPKVAFHIFNSQVESASGDSDFGSELDLGLVHKYNKKVTIVGGYSMFMPGVLKSTGDTSGQKTYLMTIVNL